jgi:hypothetical protein
MAVSLAAASLSTKAAGVFWFVLLLAGLFALATGRRQLPGEGETPGLARALTGWWLFFCLLALVLKAIPVLYWSAPWEERHAEFRLLLGAFGVWLVARHARPRVADGGVLGHGLAVACILALALVLVKTSDGAPTNRIPWAAGISLLSCTLLYASYAIEPGGLRALFWRFASFLALVAVAFSGVRGSYLLIVLWPLMFLMLHLHYARQRPVANRPWGWLLVPVSMGVIGWTAAHLPVGYLPDGRVRQALHEGLDLDVNSAIGSRIVMWRAAAQGIGDTPILGRGYLGGNDLEDPVVMTLAREDRQGYGDEIAAQSHHAATPRARIGCHEGPDGMQADLVGQVGRSQLLLAIQLQWVLIVTALGVDPHEVVQAQSDLRLRLKYAFDDFDLARVPQVVLVAQEHQVLGAMADGLFEIAHIAQVLRIAPHAHRERGLAGKGLDDLEAAVAGGVIANDQLLGLDRLRQQGLQLQVEEPLAVVGTQGNRDCRWHGLRELLNDLQRAAPRSRIRSLLNAIFCETGRSPSTPRLSCTF